jgi:hypothetical protein
MRFRGGGVGHLGTRYLDSRLKQQDHELEDEETDADMYEDINSHVHEDWSDGVEEDPGIHEECTGRGEPIDKEDKEDQDQDNEDQGKDENGEKDALGDMDDKQEFDDKDECGLDDNEILDKEGFAEL